MQNKILNTIGPEFTKKAKNILNKIGKVDYLDLSQNDFENIIYKYDIILVGLGLNIDREIIDRAKKLKLLATATTGLDHIDIEYAKSKGIKVINLRGETEFLNTITGTAELSFGLLLSLARIIPFSFESVKNYEWNREKFKGHNLYGKTLGIVGLGRLGSWMARYANAFNMRVLAYDPYVDDDAFKKTNCERVDFDELLKRSDVISIHIHLDERTENMFDKQIFTKMKDSAYLINTSRGKIVNEKDLLDALRNKEIAGYASDELAGELKFSKKIGYYPLIEYAQNNNNCIIVPHTGGTTYESREATDIFIANKILKNI